MEIFICPQAADAIKLTSQLVAARLRHNPRLVLGCATGRTMERLYTELVHLHREDQLSFRDCRTFNLDEYIGLAHDDPRSYHAYMAARLFDSTDIDRNNTYLLDGTAEDLIAEARSYEAQIEACGGIDLQLLGIGDTGHIGFNEPLSALRSRTREKALNHRTREQNAALFEGDLSKVPKRALTMGVGTILDAKELILLATGESKAEILAKATEGPITSMISATALQLHPNCKVIVDAAAAAKLQNRDDYQWILENDPKWEAYR